MSSALPTGPPPVMAHVKAEQATVNTSDSRADEDNREAKPPVKGAGFGPAYNFMRFVGERSAAHFFRRVLVVGGEDVPKTGTFILCCTHFSTLMDVAIISADLPNRRPIHYWAKRGLYKRQPFRWILENSGNIQVNRKEKSNEDLFAGTFQAMEAGEPIGLFPEGGSYTEHRLHSMKAGAAWAALEYAKHLVVRGAAEPHNTNVTIVPAAINYTDKSRFRSEVIFEFGKAFTVDAYTEQFLRPAAVQHDTQDGDVNGFAALSDNVPHTPGPSVIVTTGKDGPHPQSRMRMGLDVNMNSSTSGDEATSKTTAAKFAQALSLANGSEGEGSGNVPASVLIQRASKAPSNSISAKAAVSQLTDRIGAEIYKMTVDAPDWTTWHAVKMARELIWKRHGQLPLRHLVPLSNALVAILNAPIPQARLANETLCALQGLVLASSTDVYTLNVVAKLFLLPKRAMQPATPHDTDFTLPARRRAERAVPGLAPSTIFLTRQILALAIRLPYVLPLALIYVPAYTIGWWLSKKYSSHEEESMASAKSLCAFVIAGLTHIFLILVVATPFLFTPVGWLLGIGLSVLIEKTHVWLLDETYDYLKKLVVAWRMFFAALTLHIGGQRHGQLGGENRAVGMAVDVVKSQPGIQWSLIKALRTSSRSDRIREPNASAAPASPSTKEDGVVTTSMPAAAAPSGLTSSTSAVRPKVFNRSGRPACYRLMGVTRLVHAQAVQALHDLFQEMEMIERQSHANANSHNGAKNDNNADVSDETLEKYRFLRDQMHHSNASIMPRHRRYPLIRRSR